MGRLGRGHIPKFNLSFPTCGYLYDLLKAKLIFARIITGTVHVTGQGWTHIDMHRSLRHQLAG